MKSPTAGKSRLQPLLNGPHRAALSMLLLRHVLRTIQRSAACQHTIVVGGDTPVQALAHELAATWLNDPGKGLNEAVGHAARCALLSGARAVLVLPADLGLLTAADLSDLAAASRGLTSVILSRAQRDGGTNALLVPRGMWLGTLFGPKSFRRHVEAFRAAGYPVIAIARAGLALDIDTPADLAQYRALRPNLDADLNTWLGERAQAS